MMLYRGRQYTAAQQFPRWEDVWEEFRSEGDTAYFALLEAEDAVAWIQEHQNMTPEESVEAEFRDKYDEMQQWFPSLHDQDCYRAIGYDHQCSLEEAEQLDPLGIYWSEHDFGADTYWNPTAECVFVYRARIDYQHVNLLETLAVRLHNPDEHEVRFNEGARLWCYEVTVQSAGRWGSDEKQVDINDWRTT